MPKPVASSFLLVASLLAPRLAFAQIGTPFLDPPTYPPLEGPARAPSPEPDAEPEPERPAEPLPRFGDAGQVVVTGSTSLNLTALQYSDSDASSTSASGALGFDAFVIRNVSVGLDVEGAYSDAKGYGSDSSFAETKRTRVSAGPRFGLNVPLSERVSWFPRFTLGFHWLHADITYLSAPPAFSSAKLGATYANSAAAPWLELYAPLDVQLAPHFFAGVGPRLYHDFARDQDTGSVFGFFTPHTSVGALVEVGGYWGGSDAPSSSASPSAAPSRHFGDRATVLLTNDFVFGGESTSYGDNRTSGSITVAPGFDYFAIDRVSFGMSASYTHTASPAATGNAFGFAPRAGVDIPLSSWLSLYPRLTVGFGAMSNEVPSSTGTASYSATYTWAALSVPAVVHVASHFFLGFGPYVSRELTRTYDNGYSGHQSTAVGTNALVGGWL